MPIEGGLTLEEGRVFQRQKEMEQRLKKAANHFCGFEKVKHNLPAARQAVLTAIQQKAPLSFLSKIFSTKLNDSEGPFTG